MADPGLARAWIAVGLALAGVLVTALLHSSALLGGAWLLIRRWKPEPRVEELLWRGVLIGAVLSTAIASSTLLSGPLTEHRLVFEPSPSPPGTEAEESTRSEGSVRIPPAQGKVLVKGRAGPGASGRESRAKSDRSSSPADPPSPPTAAAGRTWSETPSSQGGETWLGAELPDVTTVMAIAGYLWTGGVFILLLRMVIARTIIGRRFRRGGSLDESRSGCLARLRRIAGFESPIRVSFCSEVRGPIALPGGQICVPPRFVRDLESEEQEAALAHEVAHLVRRDPTWGPVIRAARAFLFLQPLARHAERRLSELAEVDCDLRAAQWSSPDHLASALAVIASWCVPESAGIRAGLTTLAPETRNLPERVQRLLDQSSVSRSRPLPGGRAFGVCLSAVVLAGLFVPSVALTGPGPEAGTGPGKVASPTSWIRTGGDERTARMVHRIESSSPSLGDRWRRIVQEADRRGQREFYVEYGLKELPDGTGPVQEVSRIRIRGTTFRSGDSVSGRISDISTAKPSEDGGQPEAGPIFDLNRMHPDSSARWLRDRTADLARQGTDRFLQHRLVEALGAHPGSVSEAYLIRLAWIHPRDAIRQKAVEILAERPSGHDAFRELVLMIRRHPEPAVVRRALVAVARHPNERAMPVLERAAARSADPDVREVARQLVRGSPVGEASGRSLPPGEPPVSQGE